MKTHVSVSIPTSQFVELLDFLRSEKDDRDPVEVISQAIDYWLDNASWKPELLKRHSEDGRGYVWKYKDQHVFLPHGTEIRMQYKGAYHYAKVEGDEIRYKERSVSPSVLANAITNSSRNAWRDLWIRRPGDNEWVLADKCRRDQAVAKASTSS